MKGGKMKKARHANTKERRTSPRFLASEVIPRAITRLATGQEVELVNISLNGAILITCGIMMGPGSCVRLRVTMPGASMTMDGHVERCRIVGLKQAKVQYEAVIVLDEEFPQPLAAKLGLSGAKKSPSKSPKPQDIKPSALPLADAAELWVLQAKGA
jgi:hypothetical protein